jgi:AraC family transcriptional regulator of arabinose operon
MDYRIREILTKIERDISRPFLISELAASINLSTSRFQHLFKQETGESFTEYIKNLRLLKAKELLETTHLSVKEIKVKAGAVNDARFSCDFKQKFGETPAEYRQNYRNSRNR